MPEVELLPSIGQWIFLCSAAVAAGVVNAVAGGGTLLTFPALVWVLGPSAAASVIANATSTITVCPGSIASAWGYRRELFDMRRWIMPLMIPSIFGSCAGTWLVSVRDPEEFQHLVPWLILLATGLFLAQPAIGRWIKSLTKTTVAPPGFAEKGPRGNKLVGAEASLEAELREQPGSLNFQVNPGARGPRLKEEPYSASHAPRFTSPVQLGVMAFQFFIALYGGYFGAGIGILMLSTLALMGISDIHQMNSLKSLLAGSINGVAVLLFVGFGKVDWRLAVPMMVSSIVGGFLGAVVARRLDKNVIRYTVIAIGITLSSYYFAGTYFG